MLSRFSIHHGIAILILLLMILPALPVSSAAQTLKVGCYNFAPLLEAPDNGPPRGLFIDILERIARQQGWNLEYHSGTWTECLRRLQSGEIDLLPCIARSDEREKSLDFSRQYLYLDWGLVYIPPQSTITTVFDLEGRRIGVLRDSIYTEGFRRLLDGFGVQAELVEMGEYSEIFAAINEGRTDAGINAQLTGLKLRDRYPLKETGIHFSPVKIRFAVPRGRHAEILSTLDQSIAPLKADPGSYYHQRLKYWMGTYDSQERHPRWLIPLMGILVLLCLLGAGTTVFFRRLVAKRSAELASSESRFQILFEHAQEAIGVSCRGIHVLANRAYLELFEIPTAETLHELPILELIDPDEHDRITRFIQSRAEGGNPPMHYETRGRTLSGRIFPMDVAVSTVLLDGLDHTLVIIRDLTRQHAMEEQVRHSQKMEALGLLAGGIAHDINNILTAVISFTESVEDSLEADAPEQEDLREVIAAALRGRDLVRQILGFARRSHLDVQVIDPGAIFSDVCQFLRQTIRPSIRIHVEPPDALPPVRADASALYQVLINLTGNACQALPPEGGDVWLETRILADGSVCFVVRDNGAGIKPEDLERIFDPFFTTKEPGKGTGLGLSVAQGIIRQHGGRIKVNSSAGQGSEFQVTLPPATGADIDVPDEPAGPDRVSQHVLLVDDDPHTLRALTRMLTQSGCQVQSCSSGREVMDLLKSDPTNWDLLITDFMMPGMNGLELAIQVQDTRPDLPILVISGYLDDATRKQFQESGVQAMLDKPVRRQDLLRELNHIANHRNLRDSSPRTKSSG